MYGGRSVQRKKRGVHEISNTFRGENSSQTQKDKIYKTIQIYGKSGKYSTPQDAKFTINFTDGITIDSVPGTPTNIILNGFTCWYDFNNITSADDNNTMVISFGGSDYSLVFPDGLYGVDELNYRLAILLANIGLTDNEITFTVDTAQDKVVLDVSASSTSGDLTIKFSDSAFTMKTILGFTTSTDVTVSEGSSSNIEPENVTELNTVDYILLQCDLVGQNTYGFDGTYGAQIFDQVPITVSPNTQITYSPETRNPKGINYRAGEKILSMTVTLTDQDGTVLKTTENISISAVIVFQSYA